MTAWVDHSVFFNILKLRNLPLDVDECRTMPYLCRNGRCRNTIGSFDCDCVEGYVRTVDGMHCRDLDECLEVSP